ncbi:MAG TPA: aminotransferase class IV [Sphingobacteriaceae bacterium]|nr:aminotransferase class IV [Sphingobacteriaceae bacterium]
MKYTIVNGEFIPSEKASILISDLAIQRGYGIFDFFKTINNKPVFLDDHLDRFFHSARQMRLPINLSRNGLKDILNELIEKNNIPGSGIRITITGGYSPDGYSIADPNMIITQQILNIKEDISQQGIKLMTYQHSRQVPDAKTLDYLMAVWLQPVIREKNADDVLYFNNNQIAECPRANFFIVTSDNIVLTPQKNILKGVIRKNVLQLSENSIEIFESNVSCEDLKNCKEAFITSSTKNILPVIEIDGKQIGNGKTGEIALSLSKKLLEKIHS